MTRTNFLPISIETCHEAQVDCLIIEGKMSEDFGPWKKDESRTLVFNFELGTVSEMNDEGIELNKVNIKLTVKEDNA